MFVVMLFVKFLLCFFTFGYLAFSADQVDSPDSYTLLLAEENVEVNCSNILAFMQSYFELSEKSHSLLGVSFSRFMSEVMSDAEKTDEQKEELKTDISNAEFSVQDNQLILSDKAMIIMEVLPNCLKPE